MTLGDGTTNDSLVPVQVIGLLSGVSSVSIAAGHSCAIQTGVAKCWGLNGSGNLGNGTTAPSIIPVTVKAGN